MFVIILKTALLYTKNYAKTSREMPCIKPTALIFDFGGKHRILLLGSQSCYFVMLLGQLSLFLWGSNWILDLFRRDLRLIWMLLCFRLIYWWLRHNYDSFVPDGTDFYFSFDSSLGLQSIFIYLVILEILSTNTFFDTWSLFEFFSFFSFCF